MSTSKSDSLLQIVPRIFRTEKQMKARPGDFIGGSSDTSMK
jgi:hypothetical protein